MRRLDALSGRRDGDRAIPFLSAIIMKSLVARHSSKRLHRTQGAQDVRHGQLDRGIADRRADRIVDDVLNSGVAWKKRRLCWSRRTRPSRSPSADRLRKPARRSSGAEGTAFPLCAPFRLSEFGLSVEQPEPQADGDVPQQVALRLAGPQFLSPRSEVLSRHRRRACLLRQRLRRFLVSECSRRIGGVEIRGSMPQDTRISGRARRCTTAECILAAMTERLLSRAG